MATFDTNISTKHWSEQLLEMQTSPARATIEIICNKLEQTSLMFRGIRITQEEFEKIREVWVEIGIMMVTSRIPKKIPEEKDTTEEDFKRAMELLNQ